MSTGPDEWLVERRRGSAGELHHLDLDPARGRAVWLFEVDRPTLVLGSTQPDSVVDRVAAADAGVTVSRRRSGGGAVLLIPDESVWIDVVLPAGDRRWDPDVSRSFGWLGAAWVDALAARGTAAEVTGATACVPGLGRLVCFAGVGAGEVTVEGSKLVGLSQRRTRAGARFQCLVHRRWRADRYASLLAPGLAEAGRSPAVLDEVRVAEVDASPADLVDGLLRRLR